MEVLEDTTARLGVTRSDTNRTLGPTATSLFFVDPLYLRSCHVQIPAMEMRIILVLESRSSAQAFAMIMKGAVLDVSSSLTVHSQLETTTRVL